MPKFLTTLLAIVGLLAISLLPAAADQPELLSECESQLPKVTLDDLLTEMDTPITPLLDSTNAAWVLDLAGNPVDQDTARVDVTISWDDPVSDFDTAVNDQSSAAITLLSGPSDHYALGKLKHCSFITAEVSNFSGSPLATISVDFNVR